MLTADKSFKGGFLNSGFLIIKKIYSCPIIFFVIIIRIGD